MGCGCGRNKPRKPKKPLSAKRRDALRKTALKRGQDALVQAKIKKQLTALERQKALTCAQCPHSVQTPKDKKLRLKICHKLNRPLSVVTKDQFSKCPIGKFDNLSVNT
jgi:hypothetical protein